MHSAMSGRLALPLLFFKKSVQDNSQYFCLHFLFVILFYYEIYIYYLFTIFMGYLAFQ